MAISNQVGYASVHMEKPHHILQAVAVPKKVTWERNVKPVYCRNLEDQVLQYNAPVNEMAQKVDIHWWTVDRHWSW